MGRTGNKLKRDRFDLTFLWAHEAGWHRGHTIIECFVPGRMDPYGFMLPGTFLAGFRQKKRRNGKKILPERGRKEQTMIKEAIIKIVTKQDLTFKEAETVMNEIMNGETTPTQNAAFLSALSTKSTKAETIDEISGCAVSMRSHATPVEHPGMEVLEIVGTGGDNANTFNISTTSAMVVAATGVKVAKHGNRAASSQSGTADCLEALGVNIQQDPDLCRKLLAEAGFCFMFAQKYHSAMKYVGSIRRELGFRTVFNILGPLTNPAKPEFFLLGVYDEYLVEPVAKVLASLGVRHALVVYGQDKMDEVSVSAPTTVCELKEGFYRTTTIRPEDFGFERCSKDELQGGSPEENAQTTRGILSGQIKDARRTSVLLNAGCALYASYAASSIAEGVKLAAEMIDSGRALRTLDAVIKVSNQGA